MPTEQPHPRREDANAACALRELCWKQLREFMIEHEGLWSVDQFEKCDWLILRWQNARERYKYTDAIATGRNV